jgi:hypothetical protein
MNDCHILPTKSRSVGRSTTRHELRFLSRSAAHVGASSVTTQTWICRKCWTLGIALADHDVAVPPVWLAWGCDSLHKFGGARHHCRDSILHERGPGGGAEPPRTCMSSKETVDITGTLPTRPPTTVARVTSFSTTFFTTRVTAAVKLSNPCTTICSLRRGDSVSMGIELNCWRKSQQAKVAFLFVLSAAPWIELFTLWIAIR